LESLYAKKPKVKEGKDVKGWEFGYICTITEDTQ